MVRYFLLRKKLTTSGKKGSNEKGKYMQDDKILVDCRKSYEAYCVAVRSRINFLTQITICEKWVQRREQEFWSLSDRRSCCIPVVRACPTKLPYETYCYAAWSKGVVGSSSEQRANATLAIVGSFPRGLLLDVCSPSNLPGEALREVLVDKRACPPLRIATELVF